MADLYEVIEDSITDSQLPTDDAPSEPVDTPSEPELDQPEAPEASAEPVQTDTPEPTETPAPVASPAAKPVAKPVDDFEKRFGIPAKTPDGTRENRIPYTRVKKITEKAVADARAEWQKESTPKLTEFETKVKDYETKLDRVAKFEEVMVNDSDKFLRMLATLPAYREFFQRVDTAFAAYQNPAQPGQPPAQPAQPVSDGMPEPDQDLSDGTKVYSMEGLKSLLKWQADQVEQRVTRQVEERYKPIESEWQANQRVQAIIPQVRAQIEEAKSWPMFNENEEEIVKALQADQRLSLEGAYRKIVFPKLRTDRNQMREDILKEVSAAPRRTAAPTGPVRAAAPVSTGPRNLEDVIAESIKTLK